MPQGPGEFNFPHFPRSRENVKLCSMQICIPRDFPRFARGYPLGQDDDRCITSSTLLAKKMVRSVFQQAGF
jgi:hypothetical protein